MQRVTQGVRRLPAWSVYVGGGLWAVLLFWQAATGRLGVEPIQALEHDYGIAALILLLVGLSITPLRRIAGLNLLKFRRAIGLTAFFFILCHLSVWAFLDQGAFDRIWADIVKRPYITIGMLGFALSLPLALTSNDRSVRRLGRRWRLLHRLTYAVVILACVHFIMLRKGIQFEPAMYLVVCLLLLGIRFQKWMSRRNPA
jgi:sulfoxide reductase heme-binding subunit YedZ